jgi:hypothetical protein
MSGTRGMALLAVTGLVGVGLAVHGWSVRGAAGLPGPIAGAVPSASGTPNGTPSTSVAPSTRRIGPAARPTGPVAGNQSTSAPAASPSMSAGPLLSSQSYAQYAFQVWPGTPSAAARAALTGLSVSGSRQGNGIRVVAGVVGQASTPAQFYPGGAKVYVIEAALGDESGNTDYNLGDDGLIVADAAGRILR